MKEYRHALKDKTELRISFSPNFDNILARYKKGVWSESAFFIDCGIVYVVPKLMRYCFEARVNLRANAFLRKLHDIGFEDIDKARAMSDFQIPLREDVGPVRNISGRLALYTSPSNFTSYAKGGVTFDARDVPRVVEGIIRVLDCENVSLAHIKSVQTINFYHKCLDDGLLVR